MDDCTGCLFIAYCGLSVATYRLVAAGYCKVHNEREKKNKIESCTERTSVTDVPEETLSIEK